MTRHSYIVVLATICWSLFSPSLTAAEEESTGLATENGWYVHNGKAVWGLAQHNGWWRAGQRPNITRNAPGQVGPNRTEDLDKLTNAMLRFGYPGFEHNFGLWYDRRRDMHDHVRRQDDNAVSPFLEQPWARSGEGRAWDGLSKYDLTKFNDWYFQRLKQFADLCDRKGTILIHNHYMQHALLETNAHYVDFPWRPTNCIQQTELPDEIPAANAFYDISHPFRRQLHRAYIRKCLDVLGTNTNVVYLCSEEYTGPREFIEFWLDTIIDWEEETGHDVHVGLSATKDVMDAILSDRARAKKISTIDLRYWWYEPDGGLRAPSGGRQIAGRYTYELFRTTPAQIHRQVAEYRRKYPEKAIIHAHPESRQGAWAALMGGASLLVGQLPYPDKKDPLEYTSPQPCDEIQPLYDFVREQLSATLPQLSPHDELVKSDNSAWCLADPKDTYLVYALAGGPIQLDLSTAASSFDARWFNPRTGKLYDAHEGPVTGGAVVRFTAPDQKDWGLWLRKSGDVISPASSTTTSADARLAPRGGALAGQKPRVIVSTDVGGSDPDDFQSIVHLLVYADVLDIEGLISSPPQAGRVGHILEVIDAYENDYQNLNRYGDKFPMPEALRRLTKQGAVDPAPSGGWREPTAGSRWIVRRANVNSTRPLWVLVWGSITDVAQAVHDDPSIKESLRVYSIGSWNTRMDQAARDYLYEHHPDLWWIESNTTFRGMYIGGRQDGPYGNRGFVDKHVKGHGALGNLFFGKKQDIKMGDTPSLLYLLRGDPNDPTAPHWGGAYVNTTHGENYWTDDPDSALAEDNRAGAKTVSRWRVDFLTDWQQRMDWGSSR
ncbi:DUF6298 domain-containing protein [Pirellulales bacterium]|nr:DUF6298 domain-containing protein [Pirellulales bacterium]